MIKIKLLVYIIKFLKVIIFYFFWGNTLCAHLTPCIRPILKKNNGEREIEN